MKKYLTVNSYERTSGTPSDFIVKLRHPIREQQAELIECFIPNTFYNITNSNNLIIVNEGEYRITPGNYNLDELFQQIVNEISEISNVSFNDISGRVTITLSGSYDIDFPANDSIASVLGFDIGYLGFNTSFVSSRGPSLTYYNVYIEISEFSSNQMTTNLNYHSPTFIVSNNVNKNAIIPFYQRSQYEQFATKKDNSQILNTLTIRLKDHFGQIIQNCSEWCLVLSIY